MKQSTEIVNQIHRPAAPLSAFTSVRAKGSYGTNNATVTQNTGAILTTYMMNNISVKKLVDEVSEKEKRDKKRADILDETFEKFKKETEEEASVFSFINESRNSPIDPSLPNSARSNDGNSMKVPAIR